MYAHITVQQLQIDASGQLRPSRSTRRARRELNIVYASDVFKYAVSTWANFWQVPVKGDRELT